MRVQYSQEQAKYRVSIKRELRKLGCTTFNVEDATELLEAKLAEVKQLKSQSEVKLSATQKLTKMAEIYNPIKEQVEKEVSVMSLTQLTKVMKVEDCTKRSDLVAVWTKRRAIPLYKLAGLA